METGEDDESSCQEADDYMEPLPSVPTLEDLDLDTSPPPFAIDNHLHAEASETENDIAQEYSVSASENADYHELIQPFTESQILSLYRNLELVRSVHYVENFLSNISDTSGEPLHKLIHAYRQARSSLRANERDYEIFCSQAKESKSKVWILRDEKVEDTARCHDGKQVSSVHKFQVAEFNTSAAHSFTRANKELRELLLSHVSQNLFEAHVRLLIVEECVDSVCNAPCLDVQHLRSCISVVFNFLRLRHDDDKFIKDLRFWLEQLVSTLLHRAPPDFENQLFILNHVLRCPPGFGRWAACLIQPPVPSMEELGDDLNIFENASLNQLMAFIQILLSPIKDSQHSMASESASWVLLDSDGEEEPQDNEPEDEDAKIKGIANSDVVKRKVCSARPAIRENDLVSLFNQVPIDAMFKYLLRIERRDHLDVYDPSDYSEASFMKLFAFGTHFLRLLRQGLDHFNSTSFQQFAKRLGRLIRHTVQYLSDHWQAYKAANCLSIVPAMALRLHVEHDSFVLRAVRCIFSSKKLGMWQYLSMIPYGTLSRDMMWKVFFVLHKLDDTSEGDQDELQLYGLGYAEIMERLSSADVKDTFVEGLEKLASTERLFLLTAFASMANARCCPADEDFVQHVCLLLIQIGFLNEAMMDSCCKDVRDLLANLAQVHQGIMSFLIREMDKNDQSLMGLGKDAVYLCKELPFGNWMPDSDDESLRLLCRWITDLAPASLQSQLARLILSKMNWCVEADGRRGVNRQVHQQVAMTIVQANINFAPDVVTDQHPGLLREGVRQMSNLVASSIYRKSPEQVLTSWSWEMVSRLRLHALDQSDADSAAFLCSQTRDALCLDQLPLLASAVQSKSALASYVALQLTELGHVPDAILDSGCVYLHLLALNGRYDHLMECLMNMTPLFLDRMQDFCQADGFKKIIESILIVDQTYLKMAKDLISSEFPGPVLKEFGNMITKNLHCCAKYGLDSPISLMELWLRLLVALPKWNTNRSLLHVLNVLCREAFLWPQAKAKTVSVLGDELQAMAKSKNSSSLFGWMAAPKSGISLLSSVSWEFPWFGFVALEAEEQLPDCGVLWTSLVDEMYVETSWNVDKALKAVLPRLKINQSQYTINALPIYKWSQLLIDAPLGHPVLPLVGQKFFSYYLARPSICASSGGGLGHRFFEGLVNSLYFGRIQHKLKSMMEATEQDDSTTAALYKAFHFWAEDGTCLEANLHLPSLPPYLMPEKLDLILSGCKELWLDCVDMEAVRSFGDKAVSDWNSLHFRQPAVSGSASVCSIRRRTDSSHLAPSERIVRRLRSNDCPVPPPQYKCRQLSLIKMDDKMFISCDHLRQGICNCVRLINEYARQFTEDKLELGSLIGSLSELMEGLYENQDADLWTKASCLGSLGAKNEKLACSGSASIHHRFQEAKKQEVVEHKLSTKYEAFQKLCQRLLDQPPSQHLMANVILLDNVIQYILGMLRQYQVAGSSSHSALCYSNLAACVFYTLVDEVLSEDTMNCAPLRALLSRALDSLANAVIMDQASQSEQVLSRIVSKPNVAHVLSPYFCPNVVLGQQFIHLYRLIGDMPDAQSHLMFVLLSKMSVEGWIERCSPSANDKSRLISQLAAALQRTGQQPSECRFLVHGVYRAHLVQLMICDFPEHYAEVVSLLLILTEKQALDPEVWLDVIQAMTQLIHKATASDVSAAKVSLEHSEWAVALATGQSQIQLDEVLDFFRVMASHFDKERRNVGLHGVYTKYKKYVAAVSANFCLHAHLLINLFIQRDYGTPADLLVAEIWAHLRQLFDAWLTPLGEDQRQETASWIQQLAVPQKVLLPWAPGDAKYACFMANTMADCVSHLHSTVPARRSAMSLLWAHYCRHFAHPAVSDYVLGPIHAALQAHLPWSIFYPLEDEDLKMMVNLIDSFLPSCHDFLGKVFVDMPWLEVAVTPKAISSLFHMSVKLAAEPQVRQSNRLLKLLEQVKPVLWTSVEPDEFERVILWYIMSADCKVVVEHDDRHPLDTQVFNLLRHASGLDEGVAGKRPLSLAKCQMLVRCVARLLISCANKFKAFMSAHSAGLKVSVFQLILDLNTLASHSAMIDVESRECLCVLNANNSSILPDTMLDALLLYLNGHTSCNSPFLMKLLQLVAVTVNDPHRVAVISEAVLEALFRSVEDDAAATIPTWNSVLNVMNLPAAGKDNSILDQAVLEGCCLVIYAALRKKRAECKDPSKEGQVLMASLLNLLHHLKLSEKCEAKLPLLYMEFFALCLQQLTAGANEAMVIKHLLDFLAILTPLAVGSSSWNILGAIGFTSQFKPTPRGRFLALAICYYIRAQLMPGPSLRRPGPSSSPHDHGQANTEHFNETEWTKCRETLLSLRQIQAYFGLVDNLDWVLASVQDGKNTFDDVIFFLEFLVVNNMYTENYLAAHSSSPDSPFRLHP